MSNCVFCDILAGKLPSSLVYRDEICTAFLDIQPVNPGHTLVIPNQHIAMLAELDESTSGHLFVIATKIAAAIRRSGVKCEAINLFLADGEAAGQDVFHTHIHIFPRYRKDGFGLRFSPRYFLRPPRTELDRISEAIKGSMDRGENRD